MFESIFFSWKLLIFNRGLTSARHRYVPDMATSTKAVSATKVRQKTGRCQKVRAGFDHGVPWESFIEEAEREVGTSTPRMSGRGRTCGMIEPVRQAKKKKRAGPTVVPETETDPASRQICSTLVFHLPRSP